VGVLADCGGAGKVVTCGYQLNGDAAKFANLVVVVFGPLGDRSGCEAQIAHGAGADSTAGATVRVTALCLA
jgi:hypothetical protein